MNLPQNAEQRVAALADVPAETKTRVLEHLKALPQARAAQTVSVLAAGQGDEAKIVNAIFNEAGNASPASKTVTAPATK